MYKASSVTFGVALYVHVQNRAIPFPREASDNDAINQREMHSGCEIELLN